MSFIHLLVIPNGEICNPEVLQIPFWEHSKFGGFGLGMLSL